MTNNPETKLVTDTRRNERTLSRLPGNTRFCWILIGLAVILMGVSMFTNAVELEGQYTRGRGWSTKMKTGWDCLQIAISHTTAYLTNKPIEYPALKGWAALAGIAHQTHVIVLACAIFFATNRKRCLPVAIAGTATALGVVIALLVAAFAGQVNGWEVRLQFQVTVWALSYVFLAIGVWLLWYDLSPEKIEKRRVSRLERHEV